MLFSTFPCVRHGRPFRPPGPYTRTIFEDAHKLIQTLLLLLPPPPLRSYYSSCCRLPKLHLPASSLTRKTNFNVTAFCFRTGFTDSIAITILRPRKVVSCIDCSTFGLLTYPPTPSPMQSSFHSVHRNVSSDMSILPRALPLLTRQYNSGQEQEILECRHSHHPWDSFP